jgi:uncharacterized membrane protein (DUF485 family)
MRSNSDPSAVRPSAPPSYLNSFLESTNRRDIAAILAGLLLAACFYWSHPVHAMFLTVASHYPGIAADSKAFSDAQLKDLEKIAANPFDPQWIEEMNDKQLERTAKARRIGDKVRTFAILTEVVLAFAIVAIEWWARSWLARWLMPRVELGLMLACIVSNAAFVIACIWDWRNDGPGNRPHLLEGPELFPAFSSLSVNLPADFCLATLSFGVYLVTPLVLLHSFWGSENSGGNVLRTGAKLLLALYGVCLACLTLLHIAYIGGASLVAATALALWLPIGSCSKTSAVRATSICPGDWPKPSI